MINEDLAQKFVEQLSQSTDYNINIMDDKGYIIASKDQSRIGTFHEVAFDIMSGNSDSVDTYYIQEGYGVKPGINMALTNAEGHRFGVVGITGDPDEIRPIAQVIKTAIEIMARYEEQLLQAQKVMDYKKRFFDALLSKENRHSLRNNKISQYLDYQDGMLRIAIVCTVKERKAEQFAEYILQEEKSENNLIHALDHHRIIMFMNIENEELKCWRQEVENGVQRLLQYAAQQNLDVQLLVGSVHKDFKDYYYGYQHCLWLEESGKRDSDEKVLHFYDHIDEYTRWPVSVEECRHAFAVWESYLRPSFRKNYEELIGILIQTNWNFSEAADKTYMHKNTLVYRYNKIKEKFNMNPLISAADRNFMIAFYYYLKMSK